MLFSGVRELLTTLSPIGMFAHLVHGYLRFLLCALKQHVTLYRDHRPFEGREIFFTPFKINDVGFFLVAIIVLNFSGICMHQTKSETFIKQLSQATISIGMFQHYMHYHTREK